MVEFGLKLEDNKVEEWTDKYINYEKLKSYIKKAKKATETRDGLMRRRPEIAAEVKAAYDAGLHPTLSRQVSLSDSHLNTRNEVKEDASQGASQGKSEETDGFEMSEHKPEKKRLLERSGSEYGTNGSSHSLTGERASIPLLRSESSFIGAIEKFRGYLRGNYENKLAEAMQDVEIRLDMFSSKLHEELYKVNNFYREKVVESHQRLDVLVESVGYRGGKGGSARHRRRLSLTSDGFVKLKDVVKRQFQSVLSTPTQGQGGFDQNDHLGDYLSDEEPSKADKKQKVKEADSIKRALIDLHRRTTLLMNFSIMNYTGFVKIIKKFNKSFPEQKGRFSNVLEKDNICHEGKEAEQLVRKMEELFAEWFCDDNIREARAQMLPKRGDGLQMDWSQLRLGYRLGMCSILALWVCWDCIWGLVAEGNTTIGGRTAFPVFRACGGLLLLHWFWGFSVYIWTRHRINYIFLFDFNPRIVETPMTIFNETVDETLVFLISMLLYYKSGAHDIPVLFPAGGYPFFLVLYTVKRLIFPWRIRAPLWKAIWDVVTAPVTSPMFFHTYVADVFTSMIKVFQDIMWALCFVVSGDFLLSEDLGEDSVPHAWQHTFWYKNVVIPLICLFPLWIRFNQCLRRYTDTGKRWPNLANAFKYAMSQTVTLFGAFHPLYLLHINQKQISEGGADYTLETNGSHNLFQVFWMGLFVSSSLYSFTWDVYMDWGLGKPKFAFLGPRLMFPNRLHYYGVIIIDLVLRFMWVLTLVPPQSGARFEIPQYLTAVTMSLELLRRTLWGFFRLEHEHRHNTEGYRRVDFVPLHFSTGHGHKYKKDKERVGWHVLAEVFTVSAVVIGVSITSVIAAQKAARHSRGEI